MTEKLELLTDDDKSKLDKLVTLTIMPALGEDFNPPLTDSKKKRATYYLFAKLRRELHAEKH